MGFFDKIKGVVNQIKEDNRNLGTTTARINSSNLCGNINRGVKDGDFTSISYISVEGGACVIYGSDQDDYVFGANDVAEFDFVVGANPTISVGKQSIPGLRFNLTLKDGKSAVVDLIPEKVDTVKATLGLM